MKIKLSVFCIILITNVLALILVSCAPEKEIVAVNVTTTDPSMMVNATFGKEALIEIGSDLYYDQITRIVYWWNGVMNLSYGTCGILGFYVNNTAEVVDSVKANFVDGDRLTLKAVGYLNGAKTGEAQINLAEYTTQKDSIIVNWTPFDLYKLGQVQYVEFEMISTKENVPTSFCMDDMLASIVLEY